MSGEGEEKNRNIKNIKLYEGLETYIFVYLVTKIKNKRVERKKVKMKTNE